MLGSMVANVDAMRLTSDGKLVIAKARAKGAVKVHSYHDSVSVYVKDRFFRRSS
ncbi:hypothetical protein V4B17_01055 [Bartonella sp. B23]